MSESQPKQRFPSWKQALVILCSGIVLGACSCAVFLVTASLSDKLAWFFAAGFFGADFMGPFFGAALAGLPPVECAGPPAGRAGLTIAFFTDAFFAGFAAPPACRKGFLVAAFPVFREASFLVGILLPFF